jgi:HSP20 family protein
VSLRAVLLSRLALVTAATPEGDEPLWAPPIDVYETAAAVVVQAELPGTAPGDVRVWIDREMLVVEGRKGETVRRDRRPAVRRFHMIERASGPFRRVVRLPVGIDAGGGQARLADGLLTVVLPRRATGRS